MRAEVDELEDEHAAHSELSAQAEIMMVRQLLRSYKVRGITTMGTAEKVARHHGLSRIPTK